MRISDWSSDVCSSDLAVHRNEPLRRGAEDDLSLRPPRMRIAVREIVGRREQRPRRAQIRTDRAVGAHELLVDDAALPAEPRPIRAIHAPRIDREHRNAAWRPAQQAIALHMIRRPAAEIGASGGGTEGGWQG